MPNLQYVTGLNAALSGLDRRRKGFERGVARGLKKAGVHLLGKSIDIVPIDTGNLRAGAFVRSDGAGAKIVVLVGYVADYAVYVHEDMNAAHGQAFNIKHAAEIAAYKAQYKKGKGPYSPYSHKRKPEEQAKFLETPLRNEMDTMAAIVRQEAQK